MADIDLPLWSVPPNWSRGVTERLEWLTDVLTSKSGAEQRRSVRETPRRFFEFTINPIANVRSFVELWLHDLGDQECLLPLWHDKAKLTSAAADAATRLEIDNTYREFTAPGLAVLFKDAFTFEVVEIETMDDTGLDLVTALADPWPKGTVVYPLRKSYLDPEVSSDAIVSRVGMVPMTFQVNDANPFDGGDETLTIYDGYPLIEVEPNRADALTTQYTRIMEELDEQIGLVTRFDQGGRGFRTQFYNWQTKGRQQSYELRQLFYRLNGRQKAVWMPTFNQDVTLARPLLNIGTSLSVQQIGYARTGGAKPGRNRIMLRGDDNAHHIVRVSGTAAALGPGEERLTLTGASGFSAPTGRHGSFLDTFRLDQDVLEITHHTDSDGLCEVTAAFKAFSDTRESSGLLIQPALDTTPSADPCGTPEVDNPCGPAIFDGWDFEVKVVTTFNQFPTVRDQYGAGPGGFDSTHVEGFSGQTGPLEWTNYGRVRGNPGDTNGGVGDWVTSVGGNFIDPFPGTGNRAHVKMYFTHWAGSSVLFYEQADVSGYGSILNVVYNNPIDWRNYR